MKPVNPPNKCEKTSFIFFIIYISDNEEEFPGLFENIRENTLNTMYFNQATPGFGAKMVKNI